MYNALLFFLNLCIKMIYIYIDICFKSVEVRQNEKKKISHVLGYICELINVYF